MAPYRAAVLGGSEDQPTSNREQTEEGGSCSAVAQWTGRGWEGEGSPREEKRHKGI
jgi:hypothetical protein